MRIKPENTAKVEPGKIVNHYTIHSYGYRPGKSALDAVRQARQRCWRYDWIVDLDIKGFFDNIPQDLLIRAVKKHAKEQRMVLYIERWLKAPVQRRMASWSRVKRDSARRGDDSPNAKDNFEFERRLRFRRKSGAD